MSLRHKDLIAMNDLSVGEVATIFDVAKKLVAATKLLEQDEVVSVAVLRDQKTIVLQTEEGFFLRFQIDEIPEKKKAAIGVRGMRLGKNDFVRDVYYLENEQEKAIEYNGKQLELSHLKISGRDTKGTKIRI